MPLISRPSAGSQVPLAGSLRLPLANRIADWPAEQWLHGILRLGVAMCFVGHGVFGLLRKAEWLPYFAVVGIPGETAVLLMPIVGAVDITIGIVALLSPRPAILLYMALWALWTAALRPLAGQGLWEAVERAGNYGVPLAFLLVAGRRGGTVREWLTAIRAVPLPPERARQVAIALHLTTVLLLAGHGALGALGSKPLLAGHYASIGLPDVSVVVVGWAELALAAAVLARPGVTLLLVVAAWKLASELLFPIAGSPIWEWIERGGSYVAPLGAALLIAWSRANRSTREA